MMRSARFVDVPRLVDLLVEQHAQSSYVGQVSVDKDYSRKLLASWIHRHGGVHHGATCVNVAVDDQDQPIGFCAGLLERVYLIGDKLMAQDAFLVMSRGAGPKALLSLVDAYILWASTSPKVIEIFLSHTSAIDGADRMERLIRRKGFAPFGRSYRLAVPHVQPQRIAA